MDVVFLIEGGDDDALHDRSPVVAEGEADEGPCLLFAQAVGRSDVSDDLLDERSKLLLVHLHSPGVGEVPVLLWLGGFPD